MKIFYIPYDQNKTVTKTPFISNLLDVGAFAVQSNLNSKKTDKIPLLSQNTFSYTLEDILNLSGNSSTLTSKTKSDVTININKKKPSSFLKYSSLEKNILFALDYIFLNYPATLFVSNNVNKKISDNILNAYYNEITNKTNFVVNTNFIQNPLEINYLSVDLPNPQGISKYRVLKDYYTQYVLEANGVDYPITRFQGSTRFQNAFISFEIKGNPFNKGNNSIPIYIKPKQTIKDDFTQNAPRLVPILLGEEFLDGFYSKFVDYDIVGNGSKLEYTVTFILPKSDKYNPSLNSNSFEIYKETLLLFAKKQDETETNILERKYVEKNLLSSVFDNLEHLENQNDKLNTLLAVFGYSFDERFAYLNSLKNIRLITYDGEDNISDDLLDIYISNLGLDIDKTSKNKKLLALNLPFLLKSKGTRAGIDFILAYLNIPSELVEFNEYVKICESPIDVDLLKYYYSLVYGNDNLSALSIDENGNPKPNSNYIFEDNNYWQQFETLDVNLNGKYFKKTTNTTSETTIFSNTIESTGTTFSYVLSNDLCYETNFEIIEDDLKTIVTDECGCVVEIEDKIIKTNFTPINLYTGCTNIVIDVWEECIGLNEVKVNVDIYGGTAPYIFSGITNGEILPPEEYYSVFVIDADGCTSQTVTGTTYCYNQNCFENPITTHLSYLCNLDENGIPDNTATVILTYSGGTAPYIVNGNDNGDILQNGEIIVTEIVDSLGCTSGIISQVITCEEESPCEVLVLEATAKCTSNIRPTDTFINITYDLLNVPNVGNYEITNILMTISHVSGAVLTNNPTTEAFNLDSGSKTVIANFGEVLGTIVINIDMSFVFENGCIYTDNFNLSVDCTEINNEDSYVNNNLIAQ